MTPGITVAVPTIPGREQLLARAVQSVHEQTHGAAALVVQRDDDWAGAAVTRTLAVARVTTPWVALLDDDDWLYPEHLAVLAAAQARTGADYLYSYPSVHDAWEGWVPDDPLGTFGREFDPAAPHQTTTTILVRTEIAQSIGWHPQPPGRLIPGTSSHRWGEDWQFTLDSIRAGARIVHVPRRTWAWRIHGHNTSGLADRRGRHGDSTTTADRAVRPQRVHRTALGLPAR